MGKRKQPAHSAGTNTGTISRRHCGYSHVVRVPTGEVGISPPILVDTYIKPTLRDYTVRDYKDLNRQHATRTASEHSVSHKDRAQVLVDAIRNFKRVGLDNKRREYEAKLCEHLGVRSMRDVKLGAYQPTPQPRRQELPRVTARDVHLLRAQR